MTRSANSAEALVVFYSSEITSGLDGGVDEGVKGFADAHDISHDVCGLYV